MDSLEIPFWGRILLFILKLIPGIPSWIVIAIEIVIGIINGLPKDQQEAARKELTVAINQARLDKSIKPIIPVLEKHCSGTACAPDLVGR